MGCLGFLLVEVEAVQVTVRSSECMGYPPEDLDTADIAIEVLFAIIG